MSPNSIQLSWDPPQLSPGEAIESFELYYNDSHLRKNIRLTIAPPTNSYRLEDLTPNTVYHIRVAAKSSHGVGASTPTIQVRTMEYGEWIKVSSFVACTLYQSGIILVVFNKCNELE